MANEKRLIDANALLEAYWEEQKKPGTYSIAKMILDAPIVDAVEVVHGRWIHQEEEIRGLSDHQYVCSVCFHLYWNARIPNFKYCPNCGAKMDGDG